MAEFRQNYATKEWVLIAPERAARPHTEAVRAQRPALQRHRDDCPFCPGQEHLTGRETYAMRTGQEWLVRVVENRYSALSQLEELHRSSSGRFLKAANYGRAEVVIESPRHDDRLADVSLPHLTEVLHAYRRRALDIGILQDIAIVMIFKNQGPSAGTSIEHGHSQIIAPPIIPPHIRDPIQKAAAHFDTHGSCVYCDLLDEESRQAVRVTDENAAFIAFCPFSSRSPFEIRIYPKRHVASFCRAYDDELSMFADILQRTLTRLHRVLGDVDYNFIIRSAPIGDEDVRYLHWYFVLIPKVSTPAGFEIGSGIYINTSTPEDCAERLRTSMQE